MVLILVWYFTAVAGIKQRNKYHDTAEELQFKINHIRSLKEKIKSLESQAQADKKNIESLEKSVVEYKNKINKISSYFKKEG